ncbi:MAG: FtsH protease activity modulator HflK [Candidatus Paracaedibacteraceae bacterium]|nr:FtsH protease activity modulator HflK [Candidatus Paracaedibacteraceae bacterium]
MVKRYGMSFDNNPWGKRNQNKDGFDLNRIFEQLNDIFGGKNKNGGGVGKSKPPKKSLLFAILLIPVGIWLASGFYKLFPYEQALVLRFGKWVRTDGEGLNYHLPYPIEIVQKVPTGTIHRMDIGVPSGSQNFPSADEYIMLTGDENILHIGMSLSWQIKDLRQFVLISQNPIDTLKVAAESVLREIIGQTKTAPIISRAGWSEMNSHVQKHLQLLVDKYQIGIRVVNVELHTALPPQPVADSFTEVQRAKTFQEQVVNEALAYANDKIPRARGEHAKIVQSAEAKATQTINLAKGRADRFKAMYEEYKKDPDLNKKRMYYEIMAEILSGNKNKQIFDRAIIKGGILPHLDLKNADRKNRKEGKR